MPRIKREVAELRTRAIDSLVLGIELFNRPHDRGHAEAVLILLHHAFEMLLKAIIKDRTGTVHTEGEKYTYGFDKCLDVMQNALDMISVDERMALSMLDGLRDTSVHYFQVMSRISCTSRRRLRRHFSTPFSIGDSARALRTVFPAECFLSPPNRQKTSSC